MVRTGSARVVAGALAISLLCSQPATAGRHDEGFWAGCGIAAMALGAIAAIGATVAWACSESDEALIQRAETLLRDAKAELSHAGLIQLYENTFRQARYRLMSLADEEQEWLYPVALTFAERKKSVSTHINAVHDYISKLEKVARQLHERSATAEHRGMRNDLYELACMIENNIPFLREYYESLNNHRAYFALYDCEAQLYTTYRDELEAGRSYLHDIYHLERVLLQRVHFSHSHTRFELIEYVKQLRSSIDTLHNRIKACTYQYPGRVALAHQLHDYLRQTAGIIENSAEYKKQKKAARKERERQEMVTIERAKLAAQERQAQAAREQAQAAQSQAQAAWVQAMQQPQHTTHTVYTTYQ